MSNTINIIDLFAGPGGLGEGFSSFVTSSGQQPFKIRMSVEKEASAHKTLTLRAMYRILRKKGDLRSYHQYLKQQITKDQLIEQEPEAWAEASMETLDSPTALGEGNEKIHQRLRELKVAHEGEPWIVIGGPPCQAYSLVGRARNKGIAGYSAAEDPRHFLYREYLQVLSVIQPDVFVMENVKGILSSKGDGEKIFPSIKNDLHNPAAAINGPQTKGREYQIYSFVKSPDDSDMLDPGYIDDQDFIIRAEKYGVPQARHRVILLGVATDLNATPGTLVEKTPVCIEDILAGLPSLRSKLSRQKDFADKWKATIEEQAKIVVGELSNMNKPELANEVAEAVSRLGHMFATSSGEYTGAGLSKHVSDQLRDWLLENRPERVLNHEARGHMASDLGRYLFSACWALHYGMESDKPFPKSHDFPEALAPAHANWKTGKFADRFRVQRYGRPATTVTSHISKDGHYFIHPDPTQCRSLTVREAARIQTFPDNYFFEGTRTQQYVQVGNAVPPFLSVQLAEVVHKVLKGNG